MDLPIDYTIHAAHRHCGWDNSLPPVATVAPGDVVEFELVEAANLDLDPRSTAEDLPKVDVTKANPITGPIRIDGAAPGDTLKVTILAFEPSGWGYTANYPGLGLLADQFPDPALHIWKYEPDLSRPAMFGARARVPLKPFAGMYGVAPGAAGHHSGGPARRVGGNMDVRDMAAGSTLYLPVEVEGALFSVGDPHAAQGEGEICGTAIESPMRVALRFDVEKGKQSRFPRFITPGPVSRHLDTDGYEITTGIGLDLMENARAAALEMIDRLSATQGLSPIDAYMLCSVCADLRISSIANSGARVVSFAFPRVVFA